MTNKLDNPIDLPENPITPTTGNSSNNNPLVPLPNDSDVARKSFPHYEEAKPLWDMLCRHYTITNDQRKQDLKHELAVCSTMSVVAYFGRLKKLWDDLAASNLIPACVCGLEATCFGKHGFPDWWGDHPQARGRRGSGKGLTRGRGGAAPPRPHAAEARAVAYSGASDGGRLEAMPGVSPDQLKQLLSLLDSSTVSMPDYRLTGKPLSNLWIVDSGTSNHVTGPSIEDADWTR
ncbi:hypothetical protein LIER_07191 [Lithospermum erythrorhizon]|uniref:Retrotransposon gag domain-containing protein n=1 Tax=Lithospermum erythrorhizon TaxID=34254 RepID=A0AAV3P8I8_LITER